MSLTDRLRGFFKKITQYVWLNVLLITLLGIPISIFLIVHISKFLFAMDYIWILIDTDNYIFGIKDIINFSVTLIGVMTTSIFSYFIWKVNKKSAEISEKLVDLEKNRDTATIKESATLLYFTALSGLKYVFDRYHQKRNIEMPHLSSKWIDNLDRLYGHLSTEEIKLFFDLYNSLNEVSNISNQLRQSQSVKSSIAADYPKQLKTKIDYCIGNYFDSSCIEYSWIEYGLEKAEFLTPVTLLKKIYKTIFVKLDMLIRFGKVDESLNEDKREEIYKNGNKFCEIRYSNGQILHKKFWSADGELLQDCDYADGKASGFKKIYNGRNLAFVGQVSNDNKYTGKEYRVLLTNSKGYDLLSEEAYIESMMEEQSTNEYYEREAAHIEKAMEDGSLDYEEYCQADWENGKRTLLRDTNYKEPI